MLVLTMKEGAGFSIFTPDGGLIRIFLTEIKSGTVARIGIIADKDKFKIERDSKAKEKDIELPVAPKDFKG